MKTNFILNEGDKKRILELHKRATKNHYISKNILSEGKAESVKQYCNMCTSDLDRTKNRKYKDETLDKVVASFVDAYDDALGTDMDSFNDGLNYLKGFTLNDFCAFLDLYFETTGEQWYEATDSDIDYDDEWDMIIRSLNRIKDRKVKTTTNMASTQQQGGNIWDKLSAYLQSIGWKIGGTDDQFLYYGNWLFWKDIRKHPFQIIHTNAQKQVLGRYKQIELSDDINKIKLEDGNGNSITMAELIKQFAPSANNTSQVKNQGAYKKVQTQIKQPNYSLLSQ